MPEQILCELGPLEAGETRQRIQVFPAPGDYNHPKAGPFTLTADRLAEYVDDINSRGNISVDRDHAFYKGMSAPAAGWFVQGTGRVEENGTVTAEVDWTDAAAEQVRTREYRFISPEFSFQKRKMDGQKVPEPTLDAATLTNRPFFEDMLPVAAEDAPAEEFGVLAEHVDDGSILACDALEALASDSDDALNEIVAAAATKAPYGNVSYADPGYQKDGKKRYPIDTEDHIRAAWSYINKAKNAGRYTAAQLSRIKARIRRAMSKIGAKVGADATPGGNMDDLTALAETLGIAADASEEDVLEAAKRVAAENAELKEAQKNTNEQVKTLIADAAKGVQASKDLALMKRDKAIEDAVERGAIVPAEKATYEGFWEIDPDGTEKLLAEKPSGVPLTASGSPDARVFDAEGNALKVGEDGDAIVADLSPKLVDGSEIPVVADTAKIVAAAEAELRRSGKTEWTDDEFFAACESASKRLGVVREYEPDLS